MLCGIWRTRAGFRFVKTDFEWIQYFKTIVPEEITSTRWEHCLRVAGFAETLSSIHSYPNPEKAYLVGILHDITKQKKNEFHLKYFEKEPSPEYDKIPKEAYHAFSAPIYLKHDFGYHDEEVLSAMRIHTLGKKDMSLLQKIIYASDFLGSEYAEKQTDLPVWIRKTEENLNFGIYLKAMKTLNNLIETRNTIHDDTIVTYNQAVLALKES